MGHVTRGSLTLLEVPVNIPPKHASGLGPSALSGHKPRRRRQLLPLSSLHQSLPPRGTAIGATPGIAAGAPKKLQVTAAMASIASGTFAYVSGKRGARSLVTRCTIDPMYPSADATFAGRVQKLVDVGSMKLRDHLPAVSRLVSGQQRKRTIAAKLLAALALVMCSTKAVAASGATVAATGPASSFMSFLATSLSPLQKMIRAGPQRDVLGLLGATMLVVPMMKILQTSSILGFLAMGIMLGPSGIDCISGLHEAHFLAEFGIIFFLFEMGLELSMDKVLSMKYDVFGVGSIQFFVTGVLIAVFAHFFAPGLPVSALAVLGGALALSSSAFVLQLIRDKGQLGARYGRASFGVLLLQDLAVVPLLVVIPLLANSSGNVSDLLTALGLAAARGGMALIFISFLGQFVLARIFRFAQWARSAEAFLAATLGTVLLCSQVTEGLGLSDTLGAFLAGVLLSETKYRHQIEADIAPFRGMLLGLFFTTVGFSINLNLLVSSWHIIVPLIGGLLALKAGVVACACTLFGVSTPSTIQTAFLLAPGGEFAFVVLRLADELRLLPPSMTSILVTSTALSMAITPLAARWGDALSADLRGRLQASEGAAEDPEAQEVVSRMERSSDFVVVCGFGRIGKVICQMLDAEGKLDYIVFEKDPEKAASARQAGLPVFLADCSRRNVLENFKVNKAQLVVIAMGERHATDMCAAALRSLCPEVNMLVRAQDSAHQAYLEKQYGVKAVVPVLPADSVLLSLPFGGEVMRRLGYDEGRVGTMIEEQRRKIYQEGGLTEFCVTRGELETCFKQLDCEGCGTIHSTALQSLLLMLRPRHMNDKDFFQMVERLEECRPGDSVQEDYLSLDTIETMLGAARLMSRSEDAAHRSRPADSEASEAQGEELQLVEVEEKPKEAQEVDVLEVEVQTVGKAASHSGTGSLSG